MVDGVAPRAMRPLAEGHSFRKNGAVAWRISHGARSDAIHETNCQPRAFSPMKLLIFVGMNVFGALGWWLGEQFGLGTAIVASGIGSILGVYVGWRVARNIFD